MGDFTIVLKEGQVNYLMNVLAEKPYKEVAMLIEGIASQVTEQAKKEEEKK